ncbi:MAG: type IV pilin N-terminal domain-containing protein [Methanolobus sp.]
MLAFSIVIVSVFSYLDAGEKINANIDGLVDVDSDIIYLRHIGGESIDLNNVQVILNLNGTRRDLIFTTNNPEFCW